MIWSMSELNLRHAAQLSDILLSPLNLGIVFGLLVLSLIILSFIRYWPGLVLGIVVLIGTVGFAAHLGYDAYEATQTRSIITDNSASVKTWVEDNYGVKLSNAQARTLASGTETFQETGQVTTRFGMLSNIAIKIAGGSTITTNITLVYTKGAYVLATISDDGSLNPLEATKS
jgi:hypothetical protein